jgi:hypothetical protein
MVCRFMQSDGGAGGSMPSTMPGRMAAVFAAGERRSRCSWRGCLPLPPGQVANSVGVFADGTVLVTVLTRPGTAIADFVQGRVTGGVWQWQPGERGFTLLPGTELPGNNGIETDPDQRHFYVVAFGWHAVVVYDRRDTAHPLARIVAADFMRRPLAGRGDAAG